MPWLQYTSHNLTQWAVQLKTTFLWDEAQAHAASTSLFALSRATKQAFWDSNGGTFRLKKRPAGAALKLPC